MAVASGCGYSRHVGVGAANLLAAIDFRVDGDARAAGNQTDGVLHVLRDGDSHGPADGLAGRRLACFDVVAALRGGAVDFVARGDPAIVASLGSGVEVVRPEDGSVTPTGAWARGILTSNASHRCARLIGSRSPCRLRRRLSSGLGRRCSWDLAYSWASRRRCHDPSVNLCPSFQAIVWCLHPRTTLEWLM